MTDPAADVSCPRCQYRENAAEASFCCALRRRACVDRPAPSCDAPSDVGDRYCTRCGARPCKRSVRQPSASRHERRGALPLEPASPGLAVRSPRCSSCASVVLVLRVAAWGWPGHRCQRPPRPARQGAAVTPLGPTSAVDLEFDDSAGKPPTRLFDPGHDGRRSRAIRTEASAVPADGDRFVRP